MSQGKGDHRRPSQVPEPEIDRRWQKVFGPAEPHAPREVEVAISESMLADLEAVQRGEPFRERAWNERPWKPGERIVVIIRRDADNGIGEYPATVTEWSEEGFSIVLDDDTVESMNGYVVDLRPLP